AFLSGTSDPNAVVHFTVDGVAIASTASADSTGAWSYSTTGMSTGTHTVVASETDIAGNTGNASVTFTLGSTSGSGGQGVTAISLATDTGASSTDKVTSNAALKGTADANATVHFTIDGTAATATATADSTGAWTYTPTGLADSSHTIVASETGIAGTASLTFTLDTHAPATVLNSAVLSKGRVTLTGSTGEAGDTVNIYDGNTWLGAAQTGTNGTFSFVASASRGQTHDYSAFAVDLAGNVGAGSNHLSPTTTKTAISTATTAMAIG